MTESSACDRDLWAREVVRTETEVLDACHVQRREMPPGQTAFDVAIYTLDRITTAHARHEHACRRLKEITLAAEATAGREPLHGFPGHESAGA